MQNDTLIASLEKLTKYSVNTGKTGFEWIRKYCDYKFDKKINLICTNKNNKTLRILASDVSRFKSSAADNNHNYVMKIFSESLHNISYSYGSIKLETENVKITAYDNCTVTLNGLAVISKLSNNNYGVKVDFKNVLYVSVDLKTFSDLLTNGTKFFNDIIDFYTNLYGNYVDGFTNVFDVNKLTLSMTANFKPEFNYFNTLNRNNKKKLDISYVNKIIKDIEADGEFASTIALKSKELVDLLLLQQKTIKIKEDYNEIKEKYKNKTLFNECMKELLHNQQINYDYALVNINQDTINKFAAIWTCDTLELLKKNRTLTIFENKLAKHLYSLNTSDGISKLLDCGIYL